MSVRGICSLAVIATLLQAFSSVEGRVYRIVAGRKATALEFPYQVELERLTQHWCGGSIINKDYILTAAHCVKPFKTVSPVPPYILRARVGNDMSLTGGKIHSIQKVIPHEKYVDDADMDQYDIALLKLEEPFEFTDRVKPVKMSRQAPPAGTKGWVTGFGRQEIMRKMGNNTRHLMAVEIPVVSLKECREKLSDVADDMLCAGYKKGHKDSCVGDSGGPYVADGKQIGIVAWGVGCGREGLPGVYTNLAFYIDWMESTMNAADKQSADEE